MASRVRIVFDEAGMVYSTPRRVVDRLRVYLQAYHIPEPDIAVLMGVPSWRKAEAMFRACKAIPRDRFPGTLWICRERRGTSRRQREYFQLIKPKKAAAVPAPARRANPYVAGAARVRWDRLGQDARMAEAQPQPQAENPFIGHDVEQILDGQIRRNR